jgi:hypothetical protein
LASGFPQAQPWVTASDGIIVWNEINKSLENCATSELISNIRLMAQLFQTLSGSTAVRAWEIGVTF